jgi:hypothetical protein
LDSWCDYRSVWTESMQVLLEFMSTYFFLSKFSFVTVIKKYWNCATYSQGLLTSFIYRFCPTFWWRDSNVYLLFLCVYLQTNFLTNVNYSIYYFFTISLLSSNRFTSSA